MPRSLSPTFLAQLASSGASAPVFFVILKFADNTLYLFGGIGTLTPAGPAYSPLSTFPYGQAWTGLGWLGKISAIPQTNKVAAQSVILSLSGVPANLVAEAVGQVRVTGSATIFLGFFNPSTGLLIPDPIQVFAGALDVPTLEDSGVSSTLSITCENPLILLNEAPNRQFDDMDQQIYFPGDLGMSFVNTLDNTPLFWPSPTANSATFQVDMIMSPNGADIGVGGSFTMEVTVNYSDTSYKTYPSGAGSGAAWWGNLGSTNPKVATVNIFTWEVTGVGPGTCLIICHQVVFSGSQPIGEYRVACTVIVHS
jgi:hypothetical protein